MDVRRYKHCGRYSGILQVAYVKDVATRNHLSVVSEEPAASRRRKTACIPGSRPGEHMPRSRKNRLISRSSAEKTIRIP
jgi:hypothetical protein